MHSLAPLADLDSFAVAPAAARLRARAAVLDALGGAFVADDDGVEDALAVRHSETARKFVVVPGGTFEMGYRADDRGAAVDVAAAVADYADELLATAVPPRVVVVAPFLAARDLLTANGERVDVTRADAAELAEAMGLRLPSEAELEWLLRDGGDAAFVLDADLERDPGRLVSRFGLRDLHLFQWCEDDWHPTYDGAPVDGRPWRRGDPSGVYRSGFDLRGTQAGEDVALALAAVRRPGSDGQLCALRLARDLPAVHDDEPPGASKWPRRR